MRRSGRAGTLLLGALALGLASLAAWQVAEGLEPLDPRHGLVAGAASGPPAAPAIGAPPDTRDTTAITERPLFSRGRRLPAPIAQAMAAEAPPPPPPPPLAAGYKVLGITQSNGETTAILRQTEGNRIIRLRSGERLGEWTLAGVERRRALRFQRGDQQQVLTLETRAPGRSGPGVVVDIVEEDEADNEEPPARPPGRR